MERNEVTARLQGLGTINVNVAMLEEAARETDSEDATTVLTALVVETEDDSHDFITGSDYPIRVRFDGEGISALAPHLHADLLGAAALSTGRLDWEDVSDCELEELARLFAALPEDNSDSPTEAVQAHIKAQDAMTGYRAKYLPTDSDKEKAVVLWGCDAEELKRYIDANFGALISFEPIDPMATF